MPRLGLIVASFAVFAAALSGQGSSATAVCKAGYSKLGGATARTWCGPATSTVSVRNTTFRYTAGRCERGTTFVRVYLGTMVLGSTTKPIPEYFGLVVGNVGIGGPNASRDGTYPVQGIAVTHAGTSYAILSASVKLTHGRTRGVFRGESIDGIPIRGSFIC